MQKKPFKEHVKVQKLYDLFDSEKIKFFFDFIDSLPVEYSFSKKYSRCKIMSDILKNNDNNYDSLYDQYCNTTSTKEKIKIRKGRDKSEIYSAKLSIRRRGAPNSCRTKEYWIKKGYNEEESILKVSELQRNSTLKRSKDSYKNFSTKLKSSVDYWSSKGYTKEESEILRQPYLTSKNDLDSMIKRYGEKIGSEKYIQKINNYKKTMIENLPNKKQGGYVSFESKKFFIRLYRICRKIGIKRKDIYVGINGSREFFIRDEESKINKGGFFDFAIPTLKIIIEYNGTFWHAREKKDWRNPWVDYNASITYDNYKKYLVEKRGYELYIVWSDDNKEESLQKLGNIVNEQFRRIMFQ